MIGVEFDLLPLDVRKMIGRSKVLRKTNNEFLRIYYYGRLTYVMTYLQGVEALLSHVV